MKLKISIPMEVQYVLISKIFRSRQKRSSVSAKRRRNWRPKINFYKNFSAKVEMVKKNVKANLELLKQKHSVIAGYGAAAKATTAFNYSGINGRYIDYIV